jgi:hypothetical protein
MARGLRLLLALCVVLGFAWGASWIPRALAGLDLFRVTEFRLEGTHYLTLREAVEAASVPAEASIWDEPDLWEDRLRAHPLVREVRVRRKIPGTLVLEIQEHEPVGLVPMPTLEPVDATGRPLPIDPAVHTLNLPVIRLDPAPEAGERWITPAGLRLMASELARIGQMDPGLMSTVSEIGLDERGDIVIMTGDPPVMIRYCPPLSPRRLTEGLVAWVDARERRPEFRLKVIDLRFAEQVVAQFSMNGR